MRNDYLYLLGLTPDDPRKAWRKLAAQHRHVGETAAEVADYLAFMIEEADRLEPLAAGPTLR